MIINRLHKQSCGVTKQLISSKFVVFVQPLEWSVCVEIPNQDIYNHKEEHKRKAKLNIENIQVSFYFNRFRLSEERKQQQQKHYGIGK